MSIPTQGTDGFIVVPTEADPEVFEVLSLGCVTSIDPGTDSTDQIDTTCLSVRTTRTYAPGLTTPGAGSINLNADPNEASHVRLFELSKTKETIRFVIGWSDGAETIVPTLDAQGELVLPETRTWNVFEGYVAGFPFNFAQNTVVQSAVSIQRSGDNFWYPKSA